MSDSIKISNLPDFNMLDHITNFEEAMTYLSIVVKEGSLQSLLHTLNAVANLEEKLCS